MVKGISKKIARRNMKSMAKRGLSKIMLRKTIALKHHHFQRTYVMDDLVIPTTVSGGRGFDFKLSYLPNYTEFTTLFDSYRINYVSVKFVSGINTANTPVSTQYTLPQIYLYRDYDDASAPGSLNEVLQTEKFKVWNLAKTPNFKMGLVPAVASSVYRSATQTAYNRRFKQWLDCGYADVPHYGLKIFVDAQMGGPDTAIITPIITVSCSFKDTR